MSPRDTVRRVLLQLVGILSAIILFMALLSAASVWAIQRDVTFITANISPVIDRATQSRIAVTDAQTAYRAYILTEDPHFLEPYEAARTRYHEVSAEMETLEGRLGDLPVQEFITAADHWFRAADQQIVLAGGGGTGTLVESAAAAEVAVARSAELMEELLALRQDRRDAYVRTMAGAVIVTGVATLIALATTLRLGRRADRRLAHPLQALETVVTRFRQGSADVRADERRGATEVIAVARAFNSLADVSQRLQDQRERLIDLYRVTGQIAGQLAASRDHGWDLAARTLGEGMGVDRVTVYEITDGTHHSLGSWRATASAGEPVLNAIEFDDLSRSGDSMILMASTPDEIAAVFPPRVAVSAVDAGVRSWVLQPLIVSGEALGAVSVGSDRDHDWQAEELQAIDRIATFVSHTLVERRYVSTLQDLDRQKSDFMATTSHELRTPLTSIAGYLELLEDGDFGDLSPEQAKAVRVIERNVTRLRALIDDLLLLNRLDSGLASPGRATLNVAASVRDVVTSLRPLSRHAGVELRTELTDDVLEIRADRDQIERAVTNIVSNGIKFTPAGGSVTVRAWQEGGAVHIECQDTGIGVPTQDQPKLFQRFFRAENAQSEQIQGTGLGLVIVQSIAEAHGGRVELDSEEGTGTTIRIVFPQEGTAAPTP
ncbi:MAG: ATP-binding protein [Actinomycetia bacterium]|nr:ATP-binding protein [Actinomycetes bacterium]